MVLTIAGSSGFEAAFYEKPSIVFSDVDYTLLPSVHRIKEIEKLPELIRTCLSEKVNPEDLDRFLTLLEKNTFDFDMRGLNTKILEHFFQGGYLLDTEISESQMKEFLADNKSLFEKLSLEYIKKINDRPTRDPKPHNTQQSTTNQHTKKRKNEENNKANGNSTRLNQNSV